MRGADGLEGAGRTTVRQTTAWNGLALRHPLSWEVVRLDRDQLFWSDGHQAALDIRWEQHKGRFDPKRQFKRFARQARRKGLPQPEPWTVPETWRTALARFTVVGFRWRRSQEEGCGLLVYCSHCRRLSLLQLHPGLTDHPRLIPPLLTTLRDHPEGDEIPLDIFGIRARLPLGSHLDRFRFETGHYRLHWRRGRLRMGLYRWAPAAIVLARQPLSTFFGDQFQPARRRPAIGLQPLRHGGCEAVGAAWSWNFGPLPLSAWLATRLPRRFVRVWHVPAHNCLMGVEVRGRGGGLTTMFEQLCNRYEAMSQ